MIETIKWSGGRVVVWGLHTLPQKHTISSLDVTNYCMGLY